MDVGLVCSQCDTLNDFRAQACTVCGSPLKENEEIEPSSPNPSTPAPIAPEPFSAALSSPEFSGPATQNSGMKPCPQCGTDLPQGFRFCGNCGANLQEAQPAEEGSARTIFFGAMQAPNRAKLILIKGEGMDGIAYHLNATEHVAGREEGEILFPDDPMLSPRHACFYYEDNELVVCDEESANGVFVRITYPVPLVAGSRFLVGEQLLQFEPCNDEDLAPQADQEGTYFYSSPRRPSRFKLVQLLQGGEIGMIYRAPSDAVTLGREGNDINFPDDPYISGQHARVGATPEGFQLTDLGSKNGTFFRIENPHKLSHGNYLFIGQQLLRVEIT